MSDHDAEETERQDEVHDDGQKVAHASSPKIAVGRLGSATVRVSSLGTPNRSVHSEDLDEDLDEDLSNEQPDEQRYEEPDEESDVVTISVSIDEEFFDDDNDDDVDVDDDNDVDDDDDNRDDDFDDGEPDDVAHDGWGDVGTERTMGHDDDDDNVDGETDPDFGVVDPRTDPDVRAARLALGQRASIEALFDFLPGPKHTGDGERLQKVLARAGVGSRRVIEDLITARRIRVNGEIAVLGRRVNPEADLITVDGAPVGTAEGLVYYLLNKPLGVVTTADDPQGRETVVDLVPIEPRVYPVGRLDVDTEGLLILTNDGELTYRLTHPSYGIEKEYLAEVRGNPSTGALRQLRDGVQLDDGWTSPAQANLVAPNLVRITIHEGRNRQVRRMLDAVGHPVVRLVRTRIDRISDRQLPPGRWRPLTADEVAMLGQAVSGQPVRDDPRFRKKS